MITSSLTSVINNKTSVSRRVHFNMVSLFIDSLGFHSACRVRWNRYMRSTWKQHITWFINRHSHNKLENHFHAWNGYNKDLIFQPDSCEIVAWRRVQTDHFLFDLVGNSTHLLHVWWYWIFWHLVSHKGQGGLLSGECHDHDSHYLYWRNVLKNNLGASLCLHWYINVPVRYVLMSVGDKILLAYINGSVWAL